MGKQKRLYIVRTGAHKGQYIAIRLRGAATSKRKYAWVKNRWDAMPLTIQQAKGIVRAYGGEIVAA